MKIEEIVLSDDQQTELSEVLKEYMEVDAELKSIQARQKALNTVVKSMMKEFGVTKYVSKDGISVSMSSRPNVTFDEEKLLAYCKGLNIPNLVKTKEYVDMEELESVIYKDDTTKVFLKEIQVVKPDTVTLRCTQKQLINE